MSINEMHEYISKFNESQIEEKYKNYLLAVRPMTGAGVVHLLNKCVSFIDSGFCYLEMGTHRGSTLLAAALDNKNIPCYGVDDFSGHNNPHEIKPFASVEEGLQDAINRLSSGNVKYFKATYQQFLSTHQDVDGLKAQIYFYDAAHEEEHQYRGVKDSVPVLADEALVFVDDSSWQNKGAVHGAVNKLIAEDPRFSIVKEFVSIKPNHLEGMWNGVLILKFKR